MAGTPLQNLVVPSLSDPPNGPSQFLAFGTAAEKLLNMSFTTAIARDAAITAPVAGMEVYLSTPKQKTWYDGTGWIVMAEPPQTYVPVVNQVSARTATIQRAVSQRSDGFIKGSITATVTQAGTANNLISVSAPVASILGAVADAAGSFMYKSGATWYAGTVEVESGVFYMFADGNSNALGVSPSFATANGDLIKIRYHYEMATRYS